MALAAKLRDRSIVVATQIAKNGRRRMIVPASGKDDIS
jgi:hypothetical protein